jgi:methionyl aminopeptidase
MIYLKNEKQIDGIRQSCKMLSAMYRELIPLVKDGIETIEIDRWVNTWIKKSGGKSVLLGYGPKNNPFPASICISVNNEVIHGIPSKRRIREGDLVELDCCIDLNGFISDQAVSIEIGNVRREVHDLNVVTIECLYEGIKATGAGERLLKISRAIEGHAKKYGYGIVKEWGGHGVGLSVHEDPHIPNYPHGPNPRIMNGMVFAIEPMITLGSSDIELLKDNWTVVTRDGKAASHWEHTVAIMDNEVEILTDPLESYLTK